MPTDEVPTEALIARLKKLEEDEKRRAIQRHQLNNTIQTVLLSVDSAQEGNIAHLTSMAEILGHISKQVTQLSNTIFGPNGDNGLRGRLVEIEKEAKLTKKEHDDDLNDIKKSLNGLVVKLAVVSAFVGGGGIAAGKFIF